MAECTLYRQTLMPELGYVVYRHVEGYLNAADNALAHKTACFVSQLEAQDYCDYRNEQTAKNGTDDVGLIRR